MYSVTSYTYKQMWTSDMSLWQVKRLLHR